MALHKSLKNMKFPEWLLQFASRRTPFRLFRITSASSKEGAKVDMVIMSGLASITIMRPPKSEEKMSYTKFQKLRDPGAMHSDMKHRIIRGLFDDSSWRI